MSRATGLRKPCALLIASILLAGSSGMGLLADQASPGRFGRTKVSVPERTDQGDWYGTWFYVSRVRKMALWIRDDGGRIRVKLRLQGQKGDPESFITDWDGQAEYDIVGRHGRFSISFEEVDANTITGSWIWDVETKNAGRTETADFTLYRSAWGRQLVFKLENIQREYRGNTEPAPGAEELVWLFRKASRRQALWGELPF
jgi:hypothetical protein